MQVNKYATHSLFDGNNGSSNREKAIESSTNKFLGFSDLSGEYDIKYFSGFFEHIYRDPFIGGNAFMFITRPKLFLANDPKIAKSKDAASNLEKLALENFLKEQKFAKFLSTEKNNKLDDAIFNSLAFNTAFSSNFLPMFTNQCKNFEAVTTTLNSVDAFETKQGFKEILPTHTTQSEAASQISISVTEDANLSFTKLLTIWVTYISNIVDGTFNANPNMILNGMLDYTSSIYYFVLGPDGRSLKYWCKYTGCWPTSIPYSAMRYNKGSKEVIDLDISFNYMIKEDMNPEILEDFNITSLNLQPNQLKDCLETSTAGSFKYRELDKNPLLSILPESGDKEPSLISKKLEEFAKNPNERRDPVVIYKTIVNPKDRDSTQKDDLSKDFFLIFDSFAYTSEFLTEQFSSTLSNADKGDTYSYNVYNNKSSFSTYVNGEYKTFGSNEWNSWEEENIE